MRIHGSIYTLTQQLDLSSVSVASGVTGAQFHRDHR